MHFLLASIIVFVDSQA